LNEVELPVVDSFHVFEGCLTAAALIATIFYIATGGSTLPEENRVLVIECEPSSVYHKKSRLLHQGAYQVSPSVFLSRILLLNALVKGVLEALAIFYQLC
jgi:hypothetical protein